MDSRRWIPSVDLGGLGSLGNAVVPDAVLPPEQNALLADNPTAKGFATLGVLAVVGVVAAGVGIFAAGFTGFAVVATGCSLTFCGVLLLVLPMLSVSCATKVDAPEPAGAACGAASSESSTLVAATGRSGSGISFSLPFASPFGEITS